MSVKDGPQCPGCGLPNYEGLCPYCRGDQDAYERELVPPFPTSRPDDDPYAGKNFDGRPFPDSPPFDDEDWP
jgi:hypothetical protein